jgi:hypothetical protein
MSRTNHQLPRQHSYESTTSPRNDPLKHRGSTSEQVEEAIKLGKFLRTDRTVRIATMYCPPGRSVLSRRQTRTVHSRKDVSHQKNTLLSKWSAERSTSPLRTVRQMRTVRETHADGPWMNREEKSDLARTPSQSRHQISQTTQTLEARFRGDDMRH